MYTELENCRLYHDGDVEYPADRVVDIILNAGTAMFDNTYVDRITEEIAQYNKYSIKKIEVKTHLKQIVPAWSIPEQYQSINAEEYIKSIPIPHDSFYQQRISRRDVELELFRKNNLMDILTLVIYIVNIFRSKNVVWGTGRGSSCSSYIFYLLGLHCVDVIYYDIPITDFFKV
jgi:DNA polymerase III alpha subunit